MELNLHNATWSPHRCGALMDIPPPSYCPVLWSVRSKLASHEKGKVITPSIEKCKSSIGKVKEKVENKIRK